MLAMSAMMQEHRWADKAGKDSQAVAPFKTLLGHALVRDEEGKEMHKSLGNAVSFEHAADTIGAEVMRYMFCSQNPIANLNFPDISEKRKKNIVHLDQEIYRELLTFWNCYSFYITYASVDEVTPDKLKIPLQQRSDLDRWIISKFYSLVGFARGCFEDYRVNALMERFERFLDNLSNWYIRSSRRRFWKSENDTEKMSAYATLFEILEGTCRMMAPVLPFLTEEIYQNIVRSVQQDAPVSVHLLEYPEYNEKLVDADLEKRIDTVIRYKNLGLSVRNEKNIKVRQPLSNILVVPETLEEKAALQTEALRAQVLEEINVKQLELIDSAEGLYQATVKPNFKVLGKKHGRYLKEIQAQLEKEDPKAVQKVTALGNPFTVKLKDQEIDLLAEDIEIRHSGTGDYAVIFDNEAFVALDVKITPELKRESIARDFVRGVQIQRRDMDLHVADRIKVRYSADEESTEAIQEWSDYVCREVLALELTPDDSLTEESGKKFKVGGKPVISQLAVAKKTT
jgi:isoleucyl-tRNA synthetase